LNLWSAETPLIPLKAVLLSVNRERVAIGFCACVVRVARNDFKEAVERRACFFDDTRVDPVKLWMLTVIGRVESALTTDAEAFAMMRLLVRPAPVKSSGTKRPSVPLVRFMIDGSNRATA
jgi:hypothetical protein